jgi:acyl dehydratase
MTGAVTPDTIAAAIVGAEAGPLVHDIDARWLMAYAAGLGERDRRYFDTLATEGPLAHPLFPVCYEWPVAVAIRDATVAGELQPRSVHATHHLVIHRPPRAGDRVQTVGRVLDVRRRRSGTLIVTRFETTDAAGRPLTTTDYGSVYRGVSIAGGGATEPEPRADPGAVAAAVDVTWTELVDVPATLALVYTECARIWNPIHTDLAVARAAGLAAPILHGTATLALAVSRVLTRELGGDPSAVTEVAARFTGMVPLPSTLTVRGRGRSGDDLGFDVLGATGPVVTAGRLRVHRLG